MTNVGWVHWVAAIGLLLGGSSGMPTLIHVRDVTKAGSLKYGRPLGQIEWDFG